MRANQQKFIFTAGFHQCLEPGDSRINFGPLAHAGFRVGRLELSINFGSFKRVGFQHSIRESLDRFPDVPKKYATGAMPIEHHIREVVSCE